MDELSVDDVDEYYRREYRTLTQAAEASALTFTALLTWKDLSDLINDGSLTAEKVLDIWMSLPKQTMKPKRRKRGFDSQQSEGVSSSSDSMVAGADMTSSTHTMPQSDDADSGNDNDDDSDGSDSSPSACMRELQAVASKQTDPVNVDARGLPLGINEDTFVALNQELDRALSIVLSDKEFTVE